MIDHWEPPTLRELYRVSSRPMKYQFWMTVAMLGFTVAVLSGQVPAGSPPPESWTTEWFTPQNIISLGFLIYGVGMTVQQFRDLGRRMAELEDFRDKIAPAIYMRKDVFAARFDKVE